MTRCAHHVWIVRANPDGKPYTYFAPGTAFPSLPKAECRRCGASRWVSMGYALAHAKPEGAR